MANQSSRNNVKLNLVCKVQKGQSDPSNSHSGYAVYKEHVRVKGVHVNSSKERAANGKKPWKGGTTKSQD